MTRPSLSLPAPGSSCTPLSCAQNTPGPSCTPLGYVQNTPGSSCTLLGCTQTTPGPSCAPLVYAQTTLEIATLEMTCNEVKARLVTLCWGEEFGDCNWKEAVITETVPV